MCKLDGPFIDGGNPLCGGHVGTCTYGSCTDSVGATCCSGQGSPERAADSVGEPTDTDTLARSTAAPARRYARRPAYSARHRRQPNLTHPPSPVDRDNGQSRVSPGIPCTTQSPQKW